MIKRYTDGRTDVIALEKTKPGNVCCGDVHTVIYTDEYMLCTVIDGLGSGESARRSANIVLETIKRYHQYPVNDIADKSNQKLGTERGVVLTIIKIYYDKKQIAYCNYGNVVFLLRTPDGKLVQPIPRRGYLSGRKSTLNTQYFTFEKDSIFCLHSDGIRSFKKEKLLSAHELDDVKTYMERFIEEVADDATVLIGKIGR
ncbi:SpoIIE family protein phosphatase [Bacillus sp. JCM 19034]|uniref:SpoIIE family protein phosphatase n=1 Tax=Bacillus sp. JCM 19034 TaxID=1481928 RepID=UPI000780487B|nr:SpoIIE family protein phosphatase [Bacillus sp. JCM 19034]